MQRATDKCAEVCTNNIKDGSCSYHCMRDSYKTSLVEFCAKPKLLFGENLFDHLTIHTTLKYSYDIRKKYFFLNSYLLYYIMWMHVELRNVNIPSFIFLFKDFCPEYDPIGRTIQKDIYTRCKPSNPLHLFYRSSDLSFCK